MFPYGSVTLCEVSILRPLDVCFFCKRLCRTRLLIVVLLLQFFILVNLLFVDSGANRVFYSRCLFLMKMKGLFLD